MEFNAQKDTELVREASLNNIHIHIAENDPSTDVQPQVEVEKQSFSDLQPQVEKQSFSDTATVEKQSFSDLQPQVEKQSFSDQVEMNYNTIDMILETEKQNNKLETWNKLDKTGKIVKLHAFAEKYGKTNNFPTKDIRILKTFFVECLEKSKLQKAKDVVYNKETGEITSIPSLHFNTTNQKFTLKIMDSKRVSTLKSLTPKRISEKTREN
jgi:hypothetical protein